MRRSTPLVVLAALALAFSGCQCGPQSYALDASYGTLWVSDERSATVLVLDAADGGVVAELASVLGPDAGYGASVVTSRDGLEVYVANEGAGVVTSFPVRTLNPSRVTGLVRPRVLRPSTDGRWLYVSQAASNQIAAIDLQSLAVNQISVGGVISTHRTQSVWSTEQNDIYVLNQLSDTLVSVDSTGPLWTVAVSNTPGSVVASRAGDVAYVTGGRDNVVQQVQLKGFGAPDAGPTAPVGDGPGWISITPDDRVLVISNSGQDDSISVIDLQQGFLERGQVSLGVGAVRDHILSPDGKLVYVAVGLPPQVVVVDLQQLQVVARFQARGRPHGVAFVPPLASEP